MIDYSLAASIIKQGGIIAYPTEAVYGLGCDPFNAAAVARLFAIKQRPTHKNLLLIAANWSQVFKLIAPLSEDLLKPAQRTWPGPVTWVFPANNDLPAWLTNPQRTTAVRLTAHPLAHKLCQTVGHALVSTSANISNHEPCTSYAQTHSLFADTVDLIIDGPVGELTKPTPIYDILTGKMIRE